MKKAMLIDLLSIMKTQDVALKDNSIIFWLNEFLKTDEISKTDDSPQLVEKFSQYLKIHSPELYTRIIEWNAVKQFWEMLCLSGEPAAIEYLVKNKIIDKDTRTEILNQNILHLAAQSGNVDAMQMALKLGVVVPKKGSKGAKILLHNSLQSNNASAILLAKELCFADGEVLENQTWLIRLLQKLGYEGSDGGMCYGVSCMAMQAALAGEMDKFDSRIKFISSYYGEPERLKNEMDEVKSAIKNKQPLTEKQQRLLEVEVFFDGVELYQRGYKYSELPTHSVSQLTATQSAIALLMPVKLEKNNGRIEAIKCFDTEYTDINMDMILGKLKAICESRDFPISISLSASNAGLEGHTIGLSYHPKEKCWLLVNANKLPVQKFEIDDVASLKNEINSSFDCVPRDKPPIKFRGSIYVHNDNTKMADVRHLKRDITQEFSPKEKLSLWQRAKRYAATDSISTTLFGIAAAVGLVGTAMVLTAGVATPFVVAGAALLAVMVAFAGAGVVLNNQNHSLKVDAQIRAGNNDEKLDEYLIVMMNGQAKRFGRASSEYQIINREKYFDYLSVINKLKLTDSEKKQYARMLNVRMYDYEKAFFKGAANGALINMFNLIERKIGESVVSSTAISMKATGGVEVGKSADDVGLVAYASASDEKSMGAELKGVPENKFAKSSSDLGDGSSVRRSR